jgi:hypothetical protein
LSALSSGATRGNVVSLDDGTGESRKNKG